MSKKFVPPTITSILIFLILIASYAHFLHFYFFIYPITSGEFYALNNRIVANFARTSSSQPIEVYTSNPRDAYTAMLYYFDNEQLVRDHLTSVQTFNTTKIYQLKNVSFTYGCPEEKKYSEKTTYIIATDRTCLHGKNPTYTFNNPKDAGPMFFIYNSNLCSDQPIERWRRFKNAKDYHMETMTRESFCQTWVSPY